ncbi:MAG: hypothetical protein QOH01_1578 [Verrucomicrobiota bacterium]
MKILFPQFQDIPTYLQIVVFGELGHFCVKWGLDVGKSGYEKIAFRTIVKHRGYKGSR